MKRHITMCAFSFSLIMSGHAVAGDRDCCPPPAGHFWQRVHPVGGWNPYGGGVFHWWRRDCFPRAGGPDDYCKKPPPNVCWPDYPPYYIWATPWPAHAAGVGPHDAQ